MPDIAQRPTLLAFAVRAAVPEDAAAIASIHVRAWQAAYRGIVPDTHLDSLSIEKRTVFWRSLIEGKVPDGSRNLRVVVALDDDKVVGWIATSLTRDSDKDDQWGEVQAIYVDPQCQQRGIGRRLMEYGTIALTNSGLAHVSLWVLSKNAGARRFYEQMGFIADTDSEKRFTLAGSEVAEIRYLAALPQDRPSEQSIESQI